MRLLSTWCGPKMNPALRTHTFGLTGLISSHARGPLVRTLQTHKFGLAGLVSSHARGPLVRIVHF